MLREFSQALNYDLITKANCTIDNVPSEFTWRDLRDFVMYLPMDSALKQAQDPEYAKFSTSFNTGYMLAEIYDLISSFAYMFASANSKTKPKAPKPFPRPWYKDEDSVKYGSAPIPVNDFENWWYGTDDETGGE